MTLSLASIRDYGRIKHATVVFNHAGFRIELKHPPKQPKLDDFHPEDYVHKGKPRTRGTIATITRGGAFVGHVKLTARRSLDPTRNPVETIFMGSPFDGLGEDTLFLGRAIESTIEDYLLHKDEADAQEAVNRKRMAEAARRSVGMSGNPGQARGRPF